MFGVANGSPHPSSPRGSMYPIIRYLGFWETVFPLQVLGKYVSHSLNSFKGGYVGDYIGDNYGGY